VDVHVVLDSARGLSDQIYRTLRLAIVEARLVPGQRLPASRELARQLDVSRNTVATAYERLAAEGFVTGRVGSGTFVAAFLRQAPGQRRLPPSGSLQPRRIWDDIPDPPDLSDEPAFDFRPGIPDADLFPFAKWRRLIADEFRVPAVGRGMYGNPSGHAGLRAAIAEHVGASRGLRATADDIVVVNGTQQAIDLIGRALVEPGARVAVEEPGYPPASLALQSLGAQIARVAVDAEGIVVDAIPPDVRLVLVTPSHQFPLGMPMSLPRRLALLDWAARHRATIVEDDYDTQYRYSARALEPLQTLDRDGVVIYVGSFSKILLPTLRLGFIVTRSSVRRAIRSAKYLTDWHTSLPMQGALARFIENGDLARHIRKTSAEYESRHKQIVAVLHRDFQEELDVLPTAAGLHVSAFLRHAGRDDQELVRTARRAGVGLLPLTMFSMGRKPRHGLIFGFGAIRRDQIDEGLARLARCLTANPPKATSSTAPQ
jgi:GntR family transcriptional regulator/MocR family aminotransferase